MATIESLDLATLTNNPQNIAEALEDVLESTGTNIGDLKAQALADQLYITDTLRPSAQTDHDAIEALVNSTTAKSVRYTSLLNNFLAWNKQNITTDEDGVRVQNIGKIWIVNIFAYLSNASTGHNSATIVNISGDFTLPSQKVIIGNNFYGNVNQDDFIGACQITTDGNIDLYWNNAGGTGFFICGNFMGLDVG